MRSTSGPRRPGLMDRRMGNVLPILGSVTMPIRMPATTIDVKVEARATGSYIIFETPDGPIEVSIGSDMMRALRIMQRCKQLLAIREKRG